MCVRCPPRLNASCPVLRQLRFGRDNVLTSAMGASEARALLVARLPTVRHLNGADVSKKERVESEKRYIRIALAKLASGPREPCFKCASNSLEWLSQITRVSQERRIHSLRETLKRDDHRGDPNSY